MDDSKRENTKIKRSKSDVKNVLVSYLQRRNYSTFQPSDSTRDQHIFEYLIENGTSRPNSILYSCFNSDPVIVDQNFTGFVAWLRERVEGKQAVDLQPLVGPLFCHFYLELVKAGHVVKAAVFYQNHISSVDDTRCDPLALELIRLIGSNSDYEDVKAMFRSKKLVIRLCPESMAILKKFVVDCHILFLQILQTWFNFVTINDTEMEGDIDENTSKDSKHSTEVYFESLEKVIRDLKKEPQPIFNVKLGNCKDPPSCGLLSRYAGLVAYAVNNVVYLMPLNSLDNLLHLDGEFEKVRLVNHSEQVYALDVSPSKTILASVSADHTLSLYDLYDMNLIKKCTGHMGPVYAVRFSSNDILVATGSSDGTARVWEAATGRLLRVFIGHTQSVTSVDFHPNCLYLATGSTDKNARMWGVSKGSPSRLFHAARGTVYCVAFSPTGKTLAAASEDKKIRLWDLLTSKVVMELKCKDTPIMKVVWSQSGSELCAGTIDGVIRVWDVESIQGQAETSKYYEPVANQSMNSRLLSLGYEFGTFATLTV